MMDSNYFDTQLALIDAFMIDAESNILDVSYKTTGSIITIQVVILDGTKLSETILNKISDNLSDLKVEIIEIPLSKEKFNETRFGWTPKYYCWIGKILFSKFEVL